MDLICAMHDADRSGELLGTSEELSKLARCNNSEFLDAARELKRLNVAEVRFNGSVFTLRNRRMYIAAQHRKSLLKKKMQQEANKSNAHVTPQNNAFEEFWSAYPPGRKGSKGLARAAFDKAVAKVDAQTIIDAARAYAGSEVGRGKFVKMPATWLNQECWSDDREAWRDIDNKPTPRISEYRQISKLQFKAHLDAQEFLSRPLADPTDANGHRRWFGQLKNGRKVETNTDPNWEPRT